MRIALWTLMVAAALSASLATIEHSPGWPGWHSTPGIWGIVFNLHGSAIAIGASDTLNDFLMYFIMFMVNWLFYWGVIQGFVSVKRKLFK